MGTLCFIENEVEFNHLFSMAMVTWLSHDSHRKKKKTFPLYICNKM